MTVCATSMIRRMCMVLSIAVAVSACGNSNGPVNSMLREAKSAMSHSDYARAADLLQNVVRMDPTKAEAFFLLGTAAQHQKQFRKALLAFNKAAELDPEHLQARIEAARLLVAGRQHQQALPLVDQVLARDPGRDEALLLKGAILLAQERYPQADAFFKETMEKGVNLPDIYLLQASSLSRQKDPEGAERTLKEGLAKHPKAVNLSVALAQLYVQTKRMDAAIEQYKQVLKLDPDNSAHYLSLAALHWAAEDQASAHTVLSKMVGVQPPSDARRLAAANFLLQRNELEAAESFLKEGLAGAPHSIALHKGLAELYSKTDHVQEGVDLLLEYLKTEDQLAATEIQEARLALAALYLQQQNGRKAVAQVQTVLADNPDNVAANYMQGRIDLAGGQGDKAVAAFKTVLAQQPAFIQCYLQLAQAHALTADYEASVQVLQDGLRIAPREKELHLALARAQLARRDYKAAEDQFMQILTIDPADVAVQAELGDFFLALKDHPRARREYAEIINKFPKNPVGYIKLARLCNLQKNGAAALAELENGYRQNTASAPLLSELVYTYLANDKADQAISTCRRRLEQNPDEAYSHDLLGQVYAWQKKDSDAETAFRKAIKIAPQWPVASNHLAALYLRQGNTKAAMKRLETALAQNPKNEAAYLTLAKIHEQDKEYEKAMAVYEQAVQNVPRSWSVANNLAFMLCQYSPTKKNLERALALSLAAYQLQPGRADIVDTIALVHFQPGQLRKSPGPAAGRLTPR